MTKPRSLLTAALFTLVTANAYVFLTQSASAQSAAANSSACDSHVVKTNDINTMSPQEYFQLYKSG
ncbi:MAG: hypothetical protein ACYC9H_03365 [Sulfuricaulis sp.]